MAESNDSINDLVRLFSAPERTAVAILYEEHERDRLTQSLRLASQALHGRLQHLTRAYNSVASRKCKLRQSQSHSELYVQSDVDQTPAGAEIVWAQIEQAHESLHKVLRKSFKKLGKVASDKPDAIRLLEEIDSESDDEHDDANAVDGANGAEDDADHDLSARDDASADSARRKFQERTDRAMQDVDNEGESSKEESEEAMKIDQAKESHDHVGRADVVGDDVASDDDPAGRELNDGFFDVNEMEAFADEEEEYLPESAFEPVRKGPEPADQRSFHQRQRDGDLPADDDKASESEDEEDINAFLLHRNETAIGRKRYRADEEVDALYRLYDSPKVAANDDVDGMDSHHEDDVIHYTAADLFGKPNKKHMEHYKATHDASSAGRDNDDDADSWNNYDFDQEQGNDDDASDAGWGPAIGVGGDKKLKALDSFIAKDQSALSTLSRHAKQAAKLQQQTTQLELDLLAEKPWQMTGEITGTFRPTNSLLESTPEFERASKMAPAITVEHTASLEDVVRARILADDGDDVVPRELPDVAWHHKKRDELPPEVSQEKSKLGLGELYEREYLKKVANYDVDATEKQTAEDRAKAEMKSLFANLCSKLDALSNYHFAPRPVADEAHIKPMSTPAIAMEEVLPLHVSDARNAAPQEVYGTKRGRDGLVRDVSELEQVDRKRLRGSKKAIRRKQRQQKQADEKLLARLQPASLGLSNPYEKRKARAELAQARASGKIIQGMRDDRGGSGTFFQRMQQEAKDGISAGKATSRPITKATESGKTSNAYKL